MNWLYFLYGVVSGAVLYALASGWVAIVRRTRGREAGAPKREPVPGELWLLGSDAEPWGRARKRPVLILDVKDGWVRYSMGSVRNDERMEMDTFCYCYGPSDESPKGATHGG